MEALDTKEVETQVIAVVKEICTNLKIEVEIDDEFCPGDYIKSQILLTFISGIADSLGVIIPNECYIFSDKDHNQLSIKETVQKIIKVAKHEQ